MTTDLANRLRTGTQQAHTNAEHTDFMKRFLRGGIDKDSFGKLLGNLYYIYSQLETELERHQSNPAISNIYFPVLNRQANLAADLAFYYGGNWRETVRPTIAAQAYIDRIRQVSATEPALLIAHAYTRYMGDLSGGQSLKKLAQAALDLEEHQGINFYEFSQISDLNEFKVQYRHALNDLTLTDDLIEQIVEEANLAFKLNIEMMKELEEKKVVALV